MFIVRIALICYGLQALGDKSALIEGRGDYGKKWGHLEECRLLSKNLQGKFRNLIEMTAVATHQWLLHVNRNGSDP